MFNVSEAFRKRKTERVLGNSSLQKEKTVKILYVYMIEYIRKIIDEFKAEVDYRGT